MKILSGIVIGAGVILLLLAFGGGLYEQVMFIGGPILISGGTIAMSIGCIADSRKKSDDKK